MTDRLLLKDPWRRSEGLKGVWGRFVSKRDPDLWGEQDCRPLRRRPGRSSYTKGHLRYLLSAGRVLIQGRRVPSWSRGRGEGMDQGLGRTGRLVVMRAPRVKEGVYKRVTTVRRGRRSGGMEEQTRDEKAAGAGLWPHVTWMTRAQE